MPSAQSSRLATHQSQLPLAPCFLPIISLFAYPLLLVSCSLLLGSYLLPPYLYAQTFAMTIFSKIISGEIPSYKIAENDRFLAFLDVYPLVEGHVLVVPKVETDKLF